MEKNITELLGLKDTIVKNVESSEKEIIVDIELPRKEHVCPRCQKLTDRIHDYRIPTVKDSVAFNQKVILLLRKRRYCCSFCGKRFFEDNSFLSKYSRSTQREIVSTIADFGDAVSATHIAKKHNISCTTALRRFDMVDFGLPKLTEVLSIDEFKGNADGEKFQTIVTDPEHHKVLDILPTRKSNDLISHFLKYPRKDRLNVKYVVIDMSSTFRCVAKTCFPNAKIVADRFHFMRQIM